MDEMERSTDDELVAVMDLGDQAEKFMQSDIGRFLLGMAEQQANEARALLETIDAEDAKAIRTAQAEVWRCKSFAEWLRELVARGQEAYQEYRDRHEIERSS